MTWVMLGAGCIVPNVDAPVSGSSCERSQRRSKREAARNLAKTERKPSTPSRNEEDERLLLDAAREGDGAAFGKLVEKYRARAFAVAIRVVRDPHEAEELVQEAFLRVHRGLQRFNGQASFFTWLHRIVKNLALDFVRKARLDYGDHASLRLSSIAHEEAESFFVSRIDGADPFDCLWRREAAIRLNEALRALPSYHRDVVLMCAIDEFSYDEMAKAMKVSRGTIMSRLFHARKKLRSALAEHYPEFC